MRKRERTVGRTILSTKSSPMFCQMFGICVTSSLNNRVPSMVTALPSIVTAETGVSPIARTFFRLKSLESRYSSVCVLNNFALCQNGTLKCNPGSKHFLSTPRPRSYTQATYPGGTYTKNPFNTSSTTNEYIMRSNDSSIFYNNITLLLYCPTNGARRLLLFPHFRHLQSFHEGGVRYVLLLEVCA